MTWAPSRVVRRICLVTSGNVSTNPRLVKEAKALRDAGYNVRIVAADIIQSLTRFDAEIVAGLGCEFTKIDYWRPVWQRAARAARQRAARKYAKQAKRISPRIGALAHHALIPALMSEAMRSRADLYIAHNLAALPAAGAAALRHNARLGFDAEDYHCGELENNDDTRLELRIRQAIESHWLPQCQHLTSASAQISEAYADDYGLEMLPILNVFPLSEAPIEPMPSISIRGGLPSLYWFSQTIGVNRGLEQVITVIGLMRARVDLFLRGNPRPGYLDHLRELAHRAGGDDLAQRIKVLDVASPAEMVRLAAGYDLGLSAELSKPRNRDICLTNKVFTYLLAGVPVLLSRTQAQTRLAPELGPAALLLDLSDPREVAIALDAFFAHPERQMRGRAEAWRLGRKRFNWDQEQQRFLESVVRALA